MLIFSCYKQSNGWDASIIPPIVNLKIKNMAKTKRLGSLSMNMSEDEYHAMRTYDGLDVYSYSNIARYARKGFSAIKTLFDKIDRTPEMEFGSMVDCLVTDSDNFNKRYIALDDELVPTASAKTLMDTLASRFAGRTFDDITFVEIIKVMDKIEYRKTWGDQKRLDSIVAFSKYYDAVSTGKTIVSEQDLNTAKAMQEVLIKNKSDIFGRTSGDTEYLYQAKFIHPIAFDDGDVVAVKIMPDLLKVKHRDKLIIPVDLKTSSMPSYQFPNHWVDMRYDMQAAVYTDILQAIISESEDFHDYTIDKYLFVDISKDDMIPLTFTYDPRAEDQIDGLSFNGYKYKHWTAMLLDIKNALKSNSSIPSYIDVDGYNDILSLIKK